MEQTQKPPMPKIIIHVFIDNDHVDRSNLGIWEVSKGHWLSDAIHRLFTKTDQEVVDAAFVTYDQRQATIQHLKDELGIEAEIVVHTTP